MSKTLVGNITGPKGDKGDPGDIGEISDAEVSGLLADDGTDTNAAVVELVAGQIPDQETPIGAALSATIGEASPSALATSTIERLTAWGDSITESGSDDGDAWLDLVADAFGLPTFNGGWWGQGPNHVAARQGGAVTMLNFSSNSHVIPASGSTTVTSLVNLLAGTAGAGPDAGVITGYAAGVHGTLSVSGGVYTFTRTTAGAAVTLSGPVKFTPDRGVAHRSDLAFIGVGRNGTANLTVLRDSVNAMVGYGNPRFYVLGILPWKVTDPTHTEDAAAYMLREMFPEKFVDIKAWMLSTAAAAAAGCVFDSTDLTDISEGFTPTVFREDNVHPNARGRRAIASLLIRRLDADYPELELQPGYGAAPLPTVAPANGWTFDNMLPGTVVAGVHAKYGSVNGTQSVAERCPIIEIDPDFVSPVARCNAQALGFTLGTAPSAYTAFVTLRVDGTIPPEASSILGSVWGTNLLINSSGKWGAFATSVVLSSADADNDPHVLAVVSDGASSSVWLDGVKIATGTLAAPSGTAGTLGASTSGISMVAQSMHIYKTALGDSTVEARSAELLAAIAV